MKLISVEKLYYAVNKGDFFSSSKAEKVILRDITFTIEKGSILGIAGESGSGKTTLAKIIAGVYKPTGGEVKFSEELLNNKSKAGKIQILFQNNGEILNPLRIVEEVINEALLIANNGRTGLKAEREAVFNSVGFSEELQKKKGYQLSGGEQQRAALARLLAVKPEILILDEPFSAQDPESQLNLLNLFKKINNELEISLICIAHNLQILNKLCNNIIIMYNGEIVEAGNSEEIFNSPKHEYTKFLIKAGSYNLSSDEVLTELRKFSKAQNGVKNN